jgi:hypothetical protein
MKTSLERRLEVLEHQGQQTNPANDEEQELLGIIIEDYYTGRESQLTPEQEQMLRDTEQWYQDEGLCGLLEAADP